MTHAPRFLRVTRVAAALLIGIGAVAVAAPGRPGAVTIKEIRAEESDGTTAVVIAASARPTFTTWKLEQPPRVVVDISGARLGEIEVPFDANTFAVGSVSASAREDEGGSRTRVVVALRRPADYHVDAEGTSIVVRVVPLARPAAPALAAKGGAEAPRAARTAEDERRVAEERAKAEEARKAAVGAAQALAAERVALESERARNAEERAKAEEARKAAEAARAAASAGSREQLVKAEEARRNAETAAQRLAAETAALEAQRERVLAEQRRLEQERAKAEEARLAAKAGTREERAKAEEARKAAEAASQKLVAEKVALEAQRQRAELELRRLVVERAKAETEQRRLAEERAKAEAEQRRLAEERAKAEAARVAARASTSADRTRAEESRRIAAEAVQKLNEEKVALEAQRRRAEEAEQQAKLAAQRLAAEKNEAERARRDAEEAQRLARADRERAEAALKAAETAQARSEARAQAASASDAAKAREQLEVARRETERARAAATAAASEVERLRLEKQSLEATRADVEQQRATLAKAEQEIRKAQQEADEARRRAEAAARQADLARRREEERRTAAMAAAGKVEAQQRALEAKAATQEAQRRRLAEAERLVTEREGRLKLAASELAAREQAANEARARRTALERAGASAQEKARAAVAAELAERQKREAAELADRSRNELAEAVSARKGEEARRRAIEDERRSEEQKLAQAVAARTAEEERRRAAEQERRREEARLAEAQGGRAKLDAERGKLEADRSALLAEIEQLKRAADAAKAPPRAVAAVQAEPAPGKLIPAVAEAAPSRSRSVTLRVPSRVRRIDFVDEPARSSVILDFDEPPQFTLERAAGRRVTLRLLHAQLPRSLQRSLDATEYLGPVRVINSYSEGQSGAVRVEVELAEEVPNRIRQDGTRLYWDFHKAGRPGSALVPRVLVLPAPRFAGWRSDGLPVLLAQAPTPGVQTVGPSAAASAFRPGGATKKRYTGRRIDIDFKGADIHNILRLLADVGNVNIVTSDDVKGEVTIKMKDVPWDQALDVVLRAKLLGSVREGNLIRVAPLSVLERELEQEIARQKQLTDVLPTETRLIPVSYAEAKTIQDRARDLLSPRGKISVDERTNTLIVSDVSRNLALIEELVRNLDTQTSQVVIEARIVEARSTFVRQIGVQWGGTGFADADHGNPTGLAFPYNIGVAGGATDSQTPIDGLVPSPRSGTGSANPNFAVNLPVAAGTGSGGAIGLTLGSVAGAFNLNLRLSALESSGQVRILSSPRIMTMDNREASIEQGVAIPISVISAQGVQTVFVDAKLNLTVKPHVTNEGTVMLAINVTRNEPDFVNTGARGDPTILKKEAKTEMLVRDGDTAVIGGIYQRNSGLNFSKVPFFADIPVLGALFRSRRENDDRTEFLVFITPRIANRARALGQ